MRALRLQVRDAQPFAVRAEVEAAIALARRGERIPVEQLNALSPADRGRVNMHLPDHNHRTKAKAQRRMEIMDSWPRDVREAANDIGFAIVEGFYSAGIRRGNLIRHLVALARYEQTDGRPAGYGNKRPGIK